MGKSFKQIILLLLYFSWGSQCKNTKVDCHSLLQWTILCQTLTSRDMPGEISIISDMQGLPWWLRWQRICMQSGRPGFSPWVGKIPWRRTWQPTPVFLPGESPWTEEPGGLQCIRSQSVRHDWRDLARMHAEYDNSSFRKLKCFPKWLYQFFTPTSRVWGFQLLHILNTCPFFHPPF